MDANLILCSCPWRGNKPAMMSGCMILDLHKKAERVPIEDDEYDMWVCIVSETSE